MHARLIHMPHYLALLTQVYTFSPLIFLWLAFLRLARISYTWSPSFFFCLPASLPFCLSFALLVCLKTPSDLTRKKGIASELSVIVLSFTHRNWLGSATEHRLPYSPLLPSSLNWNLVLFRGSSLSTDCTCERGTGDDISKWDLLSRLNKESC